MRKIGLLGGMSWESTAVYYQRMNELVKERCGQAHSVRCLLSSFDFQMIENLQHAGKWKELTELLVKEAHFLKLSEVDFLVICTNTMHVMAPTITERTGLPIIHIAEATAETIVEKGCQKVLLLGTKFTMEADFYREKLEEKGIEVVIPDEADREIIHQVIYQELVKGSIRQASKEAYVRIINQTTDQGVTGVVLGCTEIPLLIQASDVQMAVFDTTEIHVQAAINHALDY